MKQILIAAAFVLILLIALAVGSVISIGVVLRQTDREYYDAIDPKGVTNIQSHLERWGHPEGIYRRNLNGTNIYIFCGLTNKLPQGFPSGPPAYVYSDTGSFLDWSPELGDLPEVHKRWSNLWPHDPDERITGAELDHLFPRPIMVGSQRAP
jgi:hypothetical protein